MMAMSHRNLFVLLVVAATSVPAGAQGRPVRDPATRRSSARPAPCRATARSARRATRRRAASAARQALVCNLGTQPCVGDEASVGAAVGLRPPLKPIRITQPEGRRNFRMHGNFIEWQKWRFRARFERRAGR